jgi:hypothetical protein
MVSVALPSCANVAETVTFASFEISDIAETDSIFLIMSFEAVLRDPQSVQPQAADRRDDPTCLANSLLHWHGQMALIFTRTEKGVSCACSLTDKGT